MAEHVRNGQSGANYHSRLFLWLGRLRKFCLTPRIILEPPLDNAAVWCSLDSVVSILRPLGDRRVSCAMEPDHRPTQARKIQNPSQRAEVPVVVYDVKSVSDN